MIHAIKAEDLTPEMKAHIGGRTFTVHAAPHFWPGNKVGKGFVCLRDDTNKNAITVGIYRHEKIAVE